jgi:hypothetical protein
MKQTTTVKDLVSILTAFVAAFGVLFVAGIVCADLGLAVPTDIAELGLYHVNGSTCLHLEACGYLERAIGNNKTIESVFVYNSTELLAQGFKICKRCQSRFNQSIEA